MNDTIAIDIETAGRIPWRNPVTRISAVCFEGADPTRTMSVTVAPRDNCEVLWSSKAIPDFTDAMGEVEAFGTLSSFCWASGKDATVVLADTETDWPFIDAAFKRRQALIKLPDRLICLKTFACLLDAHGLFRPYTLNIRDLYRQAIGDDDFDPTDSIQRAVAVGTVYNEFCRLAGWQ